MDKVRRVICAGMVMTLLTVSLFGCSKSSKSNNDGNSEAESVTTLPESVEAASSVSIPSERKVMTKEEIAEIEKQYYDSMNVFAIESITKMGDSFLLSGSVTKGSFEANTIVSYIDEYGDVKNVELTNIEVFKGDNTRIDTSSKNPMIRLNVTDPGFENSSIVFKQKDLNAVSFKMLSDAEHIQEMSDYFSLNSSVTVVIDGNTFNCEVAGYQVDDMTNRVTGALIFEEEFPYEDSKTFEISGLTQDAHMVDILK